MSLLYNYFFKWIAKAKQVSGFQKHSIVINPRKIFR
jgi:hypothetical protein